VPFKSRTLGHGSPFKKTDQETFTVGSIKAFNTKILWEWGGPLCWHSALSDNSKEVLPTFIADLYGCHNRLDRLIW